MEITFLVAVVAHALTGLRSILLDLHPSRSALTAINWNLSLAGAGAIIYGVWPVFAVVAQG